MPEEIGGLPTHPLIIHLPLVLGPVLGLLALLALIPKLRGKLLWPIAGLGVVFAISAIFAVSSGQSLARTLQVGDAIGPHADAAKTLRLIAIAFAIAAVVVALIGDRFHRFVATAGVVVIAGLGVATIGFTVKTGHEGAKVVWEGPFEAAKEAEAEASP